MSVNVNVLIPIYLFLPWNKMFFGHFLAGVFNFDMTDAPISMNWDEDPAGRGADRIHID